MSWWVWFLIWLVLVVLGLLFMAGATRGEDD